jgi:lysophospholipase L1-like esterase
MSSRLLATCWIAALAALAGAAGVAQAAPPVRYYLALGDSLSQGVQPDSTGASLETNQGYPDQLFALERRHIPNLVLVKFGCPGDTTASMLTGRGNANNARLFHCDRRGGSQLRAAELFLKAHHARGEVPLITVDIGANDVDGCASVPASQLGPCITAGETSIKQDLPRILRAIRTAAAKGATLAGMTLYDPELAQYFSANSSKRGLAAASVAIVKQINDELAGDDSAAGFRTADVAGAFGTYDSTDMVSFDDQSVPVNVARLCSWTWSCTPPPSGPNVHANKNGYAVIANAFATVVGRLR